MHLSLTKDKKTRRFRVSQEVRRALAQPILGGLRQRYVLVLFKALTRPETAKKRALRSGVGSDTMSPQDDGTTSRMLKNSVYAAIWA